MARLLNTNDPQEKIIIFVIIFLHSIIIFTQTKDKTQTQHDILLICFGCNKEITHIILLREGDRG